MSQKLAGHPLEWDTTMKIAIGAAQGLAFLHYVESTTINRTFSASSVLLNENFEATLYFGSASLVRTHGVLPVVMSYAVTSRYAPPEYMTTRYSIAGQWYIESDIYAFGVMMLDMISARGLKAVVKVQDCVYMSVNQMVT
ncbi:probable serine/threonine-protein kinase CST [Rutidosis leptorrhynchoides]|uniref:probable serine/threonine-protein kinase CST n=1 Tax=Rutidosis leptorrhynchoides TaxID=125765 RepID=UPI003A9A2181